MPEAQLLIPFALPPADHAKDLLSALRTPVLAQMLARASAGRHQDSDPFAAALPHERWLSGDGAPFSPQLKGDTSPALAHMLMQQLGQNVDEGLWFLLQPAHLHIARDHLVLTDLRELHISEQESRALFDAALPLFEELGYSLRYGDACHWFLRADQWKNLRTCTPDAACGHNVDVWLPTGDTERDWRRLHNEVQMLWHTHAVNDHRDEQSRPRINALWLWAASEAISTHAGMAQLAALQTGHALQAQPADNQLRLRDTSFKDQHLINTRLIHTSLIAPALSSDWSSWLSAMQALDKTLLAAQLYALKSGQLNKLSLILSDGTRLREWHISRNSMRKFWCRASLARLGA